MIVYAQLNWGDSNVYQVAKFGSVASLVNLFSPILITGGALLFLVMSLMAAFDILTAAGSAEKITRAQRTFTFAIIGLVIVISSYLIVKLIGVVFHIQDSLKPFGF